MALNNAQLLWASLSLLGCGNTIPVKVKIRKRRSKKNLQVLVRRRLAGAWGAASENEGWNSKQEKHISCGWDQRTIMLIKPMWHTPSKRWVELEKRERDGLLLGPWDDLEGCEHIKWSGGWKEIMGRVSPRATDQFSQQCLFYLLPLSALHNSCSEGCSISTCPNWVTSKWQVIKSVIFL